MTTGALDGLYWNVHVEAFTKTHAPSVVAPYASWMCPKIWYRGWILCWICSRRSLHPARWPPLHKSPWPRGGPCVTRMSTPDGMASHFCLQSCRLRRDLIAALGEPLSARTLPACLSARQVESPSTKLWLPGAAVDTKTLDLNELVLNVAALSQHRLHRLAIDRRRVSEPVERHCSIPARSSVGSRSYLLKSHCVGSR